METINRRLEPLRGITIKQFRLIPLYAAVALLCLGLFSSVQAQTELGSTYVTRDGSFRFHYSADWLPYTLPDGTFSAGDNDVSILVIAPNQLPKFGITPSKDLTVEQVLAAYIGANAGILQFSDVKTIKLRPNLVAARANLTTTDPRYGSLMSAFALVVPVSDTFAVLIAMGKQIGFSALEPAVYPVALTFEAGASGTFSVAGAVRGDIPELVHYAEGDTGINWQSTITELEDLKLISGAGERLFYADRLVNESGTTFGLVEYGASNYTDFVASGAISFQSNKTVAGMAEDCGLITRGTEAENGIPAGYLLVGITNGDTVLVVNKSAFVLDPFIFQTEEIVKSGEPQHLLYIVRGDQLTVFLNGKAIIEDLTLKFPPDPAANWKQGIFMDPGCVITGAWVYGLPSQANEAAPEATSDAAVSQ